MIGMFDSGLGGLSVWRAVQALLPQESIRYYADSGNCPYGPRPEAEIQVLSERIVNELTGAGCKMIVIACNTATSAAIQWLRARHPDTCFVGIEPAIKPAAQATRSGVIGILATQGTFRGGHFTRTRQAWASHVEVLLQVGEGLVECVEKGRMDSPEAEALLHRYLDPMLEKGADQIVLGCTHYPFLLPLMKKIVQDRATLIDPAPAVALQVKRVMEQQHLLDPRPHPEYIFETSGDPGELDRMVAKVSPR